jgi:hypothetical protein
MTILDNLLWIYGIGAFIMSLYFFILIAKYNLAPVKWYLWILDPIKYSLLWPVLFIQFLWWCRSNFK